jgi:methionyl-tRNA formyltransferase
MKIIFAGTPEFARVALEALKRAGFQIALVLTQPDRPAGRGMKLQASPVKQFALANGMSVAQPRSLRLDGKYPEEAATARLQIEAAQADVMIVAAYGLILPQWVLDAPRLGCLNIHASLLPRWRGAAPIHRAIEAGDAETGITIMQMDAGLDTGDMLLVEKLPISAQDNTPALHDKLATLGGRLIVEALEMAACGGLTRTPQPKDSESGGITYAHKIDKAESPVNWTLSASAIARKIRAFSPAPGCTAQLHGETLKLCAATDMASVNYENNSKLLNTGGRRGIIFSVNSEGIDVLCAPEPGAAHPSVLRITELQRAGGKRLAVRDFLHGFALQAGECFESASSE